LKKVIVAAWVCLLCVSCQHHTNAEVFQHVFADTPIAVPVKAGMVDEASGIADSRANSGHIWVEQDSGNPPEIALLNVDGTLAKKIYIKGAVNRDWEDLALAKGPEPDAYYLYLADTGDNFLHYDDYYIYRFKEPSLSADTISTYDKISFRYPDGSNNAEAIIVDSQSKDIYIITKSDVKTNIYKLPYPQSTTVTNDAVLVGTLPLSVVVGAGISPQGNEIIVKTYTGLYYWKRTTETIEQTFKKPAATLEYQLEIQGEAVGFKNDNTGFYTLSEKPALVGNVNLNFYKRN
jgi:hypothetical protein